LTLNKDIVLDNNFDFCSKKDKDFKEETLCQQNIFYKYVVDDPIGFILFYVFVVLFIAFLFQLSKKNLRRRKNDKNFKQ